MDPDESVALVEQAKEGDKFAFGSLYKEFMPRIYRYILYLVTDIQRAENLTQETFLKTWKYLPKFSSKKGTFQAFLYRIARNLVIDYQRKKKAVPLGIEFSKKLASREDLEKSYERQEKVAELKKALSKLPVFDRELIVLRYFEELSFNEIAKTVRKKEGAVRVRVHRALAILRKNI
ncbi:MAG: RNA polymerase sigma factor [Candidatus Sifarchaeia archaeon]|jgi:RNA polymerase sigma-70 factor (ECF subfamily)